MELEEQAENTPITPEEIHEAEPQEPKKSLKEEIRENYKAAKEKESSDAAPQKDEKPLKSVLPDNEVKNSLPGAIPAANTSKEVKPTIPAINAPLGWKAETKAKWDKLPREIQEEVNRRESEMEKKLSQVDEERQFGKQLKETINPYMPLINSSGSTPQKAITELFNYAHILQTGSPSAKAQLLWQLAQRWGADMRITPQAASQPHFQLQTLQEELAKTKEQLANLPTMLQQQQEDVKLKAVIEAFAADPKNVYYEKVKAVMASLLSSGSAQDLPDAYNKACFADPDIRSTLLTEQKKAEEAARSAERKAKAEAARNAASSVKGSPGLNGASMTPVKRSLREELRANFRSATEH